MSRSDEKSAARQESYPSIVSIHDVAPDTLPNTLKILRLMRRYHVEPITLLVIPGKEWTAHDLRLLRELESQGCELAGHGWHHVCPSIGSWYHRLHSVVLSRNMAEHLSHDASEIFEMICRCHGWFESVDLPPPRFYVPPAWAMGALPLDRLHETPFEFFEILSGYYHAPSRTMRRTNLVGYEADTMFRAYALRSFNALNLAASSVTGAPLRVGIHPYDFEYKIRLDLLALLQKTSRFISHADLF